MNSKQINKNIQNFLELIQEQKSVPWTSRFHLILDTFEDFLLGQPEPPQEWKDRLGESASKFDYYQIVLPDDFQDPYEDDLGNIRRLRGEFENSASMALEHLLISRNYFIFENGHAEPIPAPKPLLMLESVDDPNSKIDWDCCISIFQDGSYYAYNLDHDEEEELGEDFQTSLEKRLPLLSEMGLVIPVEGRDYGYLRH